MSICLVVNLARYAHKNSKNSMPDIDSICLQMNIFQWLKIIFLCGKNGTSVTIGHLSPLKATSFEISCLFAPHQRVKKPYFHFIGKYNN